MSDRGVPKWGFVGFGGMIAASDVPEEVQAMMSTLDDREISIIGGMSIILALNESDEPLPSFERGRMADSLVGVFQGLGVSVEDAQTAVERLTVLSGGLPGAPIDWDGELNGLARE